jgi:hypothetical protein
LGLKGRKHSAGAGLLPTAEQLTRFIHPSGEGRFQRTFIACDFLFSIIYIGEISYNTRVYIYSSDFSPIDSITRSSHRSSSLASVYHPTVTQLFDAVKPREVLYIPGDLAV